MQVLERTELRFASGGGFNVESRYEANNFTGYTISVRDETDAPDSEFGGEFCCPDLAHVDRTPARDTEARINHAQTVEWLLTINTGLVRIA